MIASLPQESPARGRLDRGVARLGGGRQGCALPRLKHVQRRIVFIKMKCSQSTHDHEVSKAFEANVALREINLKLDARRVHALLWFLLATGVAVHALRLPSGIGERGTEYCKCSGHQRGVVGRYCSIREMLAVLQPDARRPTPPTCKLDKVPYGRIETMQKDGASQAPTVEYSTNVLR